MRRQRATYWEYTSNHPEGKDCERFNKYGYSKELISFLQYSDLNTLGNAVEVHYSKSDRFGRTVTVSAPKEIWEQAMIDLSKQLGKDL